MTDAPRAVTDAERPFWETVARLYREYGTETETTMTDELVGTYRVRGGDNTVDVVADGDDRYRFAGPTVIDATYRCNAAHIRKMLSLGMMMPETTETESTTHYHVVEFIDGCLHDDDSGPIETLDEARAELRDRVVGHNETDTWINEQRYPHAPYMPAGQDRYQRGLHILKIETCTGDCDDTAGLRCTSGTLLSMPCYDDNCDDNHNR